MRALICTAAVLLSAVAHAHFRFLLPDGGTIDWMETSAAGDPTGGSQKANPCDYGTLPTGIVTTLTAGQTYGVRIEETVPHGGHYRVAMAPDAGDIPAPTAASDCSSRTPPPIMYPVLVDGALQHDSGQAPYLSPESIDITVPNVSGQQILQVVEFMTPHGPPCFYYHCAVVNVVGGTGGGSGTGGGAGGGTGGAGGGSATGGGSGGSGGSAGGAAGGSAGAAGGAAGGGIYDQDNMPVRGCGCRTGFEPLSVLVLLAGLIRRRR